jgi:hypothetical protein
MDVSEFFWDAKLDELKSGYVQKENHFVCLLCGKKIEKGVIYADEGSLYEAERYVRIHIEKAHQSVFEYLINLDKRLTGLSDHQKGIINLFYQGKGDAEVQKEMNIGSRSTIRNHRFALREKERQSKVFLAIMEFVREKNKDSSEFLSPHKTARMVNDRYNFTQEESEEMLRKYFPEGTQGPLKTFSMKEKGKLLVLREIAKRFQGEKIYDEKQVNQILKAVYEDYVTLRRYLIEYGFLERKPDGSQYWLKGSSVKKEEKNMDRKKELKQQYKEVKTQAGIYQIKNTKNQKILIASTMNLKTMNGKRFELTMGSHRNKSLQSDWNEFGENAFAFEVLEVLEIKEDEYFDAKDALEKLEEKWLNTLQPFGERGYNNL